MFHNPLNLLVVFVNLLVLLIVVTVDIVAIVVVGYRNLYLKFGQVAAEILL